MRLWRINLYHSCKVCNGKLGDRIKWGFRALLLLPVYAMIKILQYAFEIILIGVLAQYVYMDINYNDSTISNAIQAQTLDVIDKLKESL